MGFIIELEHCEPRFIYKLRTIFLRKYIYVIP